MTDLQARAVLADALADANVPGLWHERLGERFRLGEVDPALASLELDSLVLMELCIAIEAHTGLELVPERLQRFASLGTLARHIAKAA